MTDNSLYKTLGVYFLKLLNLLLLIFLVSCVGTVDEGNPEITNFSEPDRDGFQYNGIIKSYAIAHDKIEIEFEESFTSDKYTYYLHINEDAPIKLSLESLKDGQSGLKKYTAKNLVPGRSYKLRVSVVHENGATSKNENIEIVSTFDNRVADFDGIVDVQPVTGSYHTSARVTWVPSVIKGAYESGPFDVRFYEVTYIPASTGLTNMNVIGADGRQFVRVSASPSNNPSFVEINTLEPNTSYYFQVRAIHDLYIDQENDFNQNGTPITINRDLNTTWYRYRTGSDNGTFDFNTNSVIVKNGAGQSGLNTIRVFWRPAEGIFNGYKVFYRKYNEGTEEGDDGTDVTIDDELTKEVMQGYLNESKTEFYKSASVSDTFISISSLDAYSKYQVKVVACRTPACKVYPDTDNDSSIVSTLNWIRTEPILAPFFGINFLQNPDDATDTSKIRATFDLPSLDIGFANNLNLYCLDPNNYQNYVKLQRGSANAATGDVGNCNGLYYNENININSTTSLTINPVNNLANSSEEDASYCFAVVPSIEGGGYEFKELDTANWVIRCIKPEIPTPNIEEFPGIKDGCNLNNDAVTLNWDAPTGGVYNKFRIFKYRKENDSARLSFFDGINQTLNHTNSNYEFITKNIDEHTHTFSDLDSGDTYFFGVLAVADSGTSNDYTDDLYSESNLKIIECGITYPKATFDEWTRVFAVGPRIDGRVPLDNPIGTFNPASRIWEAINLEGIPYEVKVTGDYQAGFLVDNSANNNYSRAPGNFETPAPNSFSSLFDGKPSEEGFAASRNGIVSLAWRDVSLSFAQDKFINNQNHSTRSSRTFGYRVYRSDNNKKDWIDLTDNSGLIHAGNYTYRQRSNSSDITQKMVFFTDYSVSSLNNNDQGNERARIYWYKIVPVYDDVELSYVSNSDHMIKVTLPPANMALVHRMMANRNICTEMNLSIDKSNFYSCEYNGLGSIAKTSPWRLGETVYDLGGDLLVDRNELGCNYTRGAASSTPETSNSFYDRASHNDSGANTMAAMFTGRSTDAVGGDSLAFRGCTLGVGRDPLLDTLMSGGVDRTEFNASEPFGTQYTGVDFDKMIYGDCLMSNQVSVFSGACADPQRTSSESINYPGMPKSTAFDGRTCTDHTDGTDAFIPQYYSGNDDNQKGLYDKSMIQNFTIQAEHLAVIYNRRHASSELVSPYGPGDSQILNNSNGSYSAVQSCFINIASIGADRAGLNPLWSSRWVSANRLNNVKSSQGFTSYVDKTVNELHQDNSLYDSTDYRIPNPDLWNTNRFVDSTKLGRIFSSNSAKLPPLNGFSRREAQRLCSTYQVEVGFSSDDGENFVGLQMPRSKRLLRKNEFIVAAAHPDTRSNSTITNIETRNTNSSADGENGCVTGGTNSIAAPSDLFFNSNGGNTNLSSNLTMAGVSDVPLFTGSSDQDSVSFNSQRCQSRYGVQDLIGNTEDLGAEILFCDYPLDAIFFGRSGIESESVLVDGYYDSNNDGLLDSRDTYRRLYGYNGERFWMENTTSKAKVRLSGLDGEFETSDDIILDNGNIWVRKDANSGYCSLVDSDTSRSSVPTNYIQESGLFENVFNFVGQLNTNLVLKENKEDQRSVNFMRNGDGYFFNTGPTHLAPKIGDYDNTLSLVSRGISDFDEDNQRVGKYFNPVVGLPLMCSDSSCSTSADDNKRITTNELVDANESYIINNFPIGNSQIFHSSIGTTKNTVKVSQSQSNVNDIEVTVITEIQLNTPGLPTADPATHFPAITPSAVIMRSPSQMDANELGGGDLRTEEERFNIARHSELIFSNGGSYKENYNGRYGMRIYTETATNDGRYNGNRRTVGVRCAVKVNE